MHAKKKAFPELQSFTAVIAREAGEPGPYAGRVAENLEDSGFSR
jgi:hypothetical protein